MPTLTENLPSHVNYIYLYSPPFLLLSTLITVILNMKTLVSNVQNYIHNIQYNFLHLVSCLKLKK